MVPDATALFDIEYRKIEQAAVRYDIVDRAKSADVTIDLNDVDAVRGLTLPPCDVILCMETLEHLCNPGMVCDKIAAAVRHGATAYITVPAQSAFWTFYEAHGFDGAKWGFPALGHWDKAHHLYGFCRHHFNVFLSDNFSGLNVSVHNCMGRYIGWLYPIAWLATLGRGVSFGAIITAWKM